MADLATLQELSSRLAVFGDRPAVVAFGKAGAESWSYAELSDHARRLASGLIAGGVTAGEIVGLFARNSPQWIVACLGIAGAGAVVAPIDHLLDGDDLAAVLADAGCRRVFTTGDRAAQIRAAGLEPILLDAEGAEGNATGWREILSARAEAGADADPEATAALFYTSGTTGRPKGVPLANRNLAANVNALLALDIVGTDQRVLMPLPFHHVYPFIVGLLAPLAMGATILIPAALDAAEIARGIRDGEATVMVGVPRLYEALDAGIADRVHAGGAPARLIFSALLTLSLGLGRFFALAVGRVLFGPLRRRVGPRLALLVSGGAQLDGALERRLGAFGWEVLTGYGLTENAAIATFNPPGRARAESAGLPAPGTEIRIAAPDPDGTGEVQIRGASVFAGYRNRPDESRAAFTEDGWLRTGDLGRLDGDGYLTITGRSKELIVLSGGKNVAPEALEVVYGGSPYVQEIAVLERGGALVALVVPDLEALRALGAYHVEDALRVSLGERALSMPTHKRLSGFAVSRTVLPRTRLGKLRRHLLPDLYERAKTGQAQPARPLSEADEKLLGQPVVADAWAWLQEQYPDGALALDTSPQLDLGLDSLAWTDLVAGLERAVGIRLTDAAIARVITLHDLMQAVATAMQTGAGPAERDAFDQIPAEDEVWLTRPGGVMRALGPVLHGLGRVLGHSYFRLQTEGLETLPPTGPLVLVSNHASILDAPLLYVALPRRRLARFWWAGDRKVAFANAALRLLVRIGQAFPVEDRKPAASIAKGARILARGDSVVWFPEAWRSPTGELQPFRPGIGDLLTRTGARAVPVRISGSFEVMPRGARIPRPGRIRVRFGPARSVDELDSAGHGADRAARIADALHGAVAALGED